MTRDRLVMILLPVAAFLLLGAQDCGMSGDPNAPPVLGELQRRLQVFLEAVALTPADIIPPPGWFEPRDGAEFWNRPVNVTGFSIRGQDRPMLNPRGGPAVAEIHLMDNAGPDPRSIQQLNLLPVGQDYVWRGITHIYRGENSLGARTRIDGAFSEYAVIRVVGHGPLLPPPPPSGTGPLESEQEFRQLLSANFATVQEEPLRIDRVDDALRFKFWVEVQKVLENGCAAAYWSANDLSTLLCGGKDVAKHHNDRATILGFYLTEFRVALDAAELMFPGYGLAGRMTVAGIKGLADAVADLSLQSESRRIDYVKLLKPVAAESAALAYRNFVNEYLAGRLGSVTIESAHDAYASLRDEAPIQEKAREFLNPTSEIGTPIQGAQATYRVAFTVSRVTSYVVVFLSSDRAADRDKFILVLFKVRWADLGQLTAGQATARLCTVAEQRCQPILGRF